jgi:outer membrane receptor protein involved in Fe transport
MLFQLEAIMGCSQKSWRRIVATALVFLFAGTAQAQESTATIRGQVTSEGAPAPAGLKVVAVSKDSGFEYKTVTLTDGSYAITGLPPGEYEIRITDPNGTAKSEPLTLNVGDTASVDLSFKAERRTGAEEIVVVGSRRRKAVKNSEVGTNVAPVVIEGLPQVTHNFLAAADLAPGVTFEQDPSTGYTAVKSGAQNHDNVNVFIDGVSQKNNILRGGVVGQDSSRGNPFPQSAVKEFKVITQNYKAEFDQVSSAAITAVTKSGGNEVHGDVYFDRTETAWRSKSPLEIQREQAGQLLQPSNKNEFGVSFGGPIQKDKINFFLAYDGKNIGDSRQVLPRNLDKLPGSAGIVPSISKMGGSYVDSFNEHLIFGKVNAELDPDRKLTISSTIRVESDHVPEDLNLSAPGNDKNRSNNEFRLDALHEWNLGNDLVSETRLDYQNAYWKPQSSLNAPEIRYKVSTATPATVDNGQDVILTGGSPDNQSRGQKGFTVAESLAYAGLAKHVFKGGAKLAFLNYDLSGTSRGVDVVNVLIDPTSGNPYYDAASGNCTGTNIRNGGSNSDQCRIDRALDPTSVSINNNQIGIYAQDDWDLTNQLQLNLGVRWDIETNMLNNSYVTPADRVAALNAPDTRTFPNETAPAGQTYAQSLAKGGINIGDYIADGQSRKTFLGAIAPRLGAAYDLFGDKGTIIFAGYGRSYDRAMANHALDEKQKNLQPKGEIWLIKNDFKMPYTDQFSAGVRQAVFLFNVEAVISELDGKNQFQWFSGNRDLVGGWGTQSTIDPLWGGPPGFGSLILGDFIGETRTRMLMLKAEKPYTKATGWTVAVAYTFADAQTKHREWNDDIFDWTYGRAPPDRPWNTSRLVDKHRLVVAALADNVLPWDFVLSGKFTYGSGIARRVVGCPFVGDNPCDIKNGGAVAFRADSPAFKQFDLSVAKRFGTGPGAFEVRADIFNLFDWTNDLYDTNAWGGVGAQPGKPANQLGLDNVDLNKPIGIRGPTRALKVSASYSF